MTSARSSSVGNKRLKRSSTCIEGRWEGRAHSGGHLKFTSQAADLHRSRPAIEPGINARALDLQPHDRPPQQVKRDLKGADADVN